MSDVLTLSAPMTTTFSVAGLTLQVSPPVVVITLTDNNGAGRAFTYTGSSASTLIGALNVGNFSTNSLQKQILQQLVTDGHLQGTVS